MEDNYPKRCPVCQRPLQEIRFGVAFTALKASIIDKVKSRNGSRIFARDICPSANPTTTKTHIFQINEKLMDTDYHIEGKAGYFGGYRLVKKRKCDQ